LVFNFLPRISAGLRKEIKDEAEELWNESIATLKDRLRRNQQKVGGTKPELVRSSNFNLVSLFFFLFFS
jgi:hypothetical protein